ncbi:MAG TPA: glutathione S-transferase N-terminal domain-containing protein [Novosphingobium sp.]|nr:glutathione S-transferase N-terminal domain-containing protein [Novosphingobium sp.]
MTAEFKPVLYLKDKCPWCLKLRLFLLEAGLVGQFDERIFAPGDANEPVIRAALAPHFDKVTFPTVELAPGRFLQDSQAIIEHYAEAGAIDVAALPLLDQYVRGPLATMGGLRREIAELQAQIPA